MYRVIPLTKGYAAIIDAGNFRRVNRYSWHVHFSRGKGRHTGAPYARTTINGAKVYLHRFVLNAGGGTHVDHKNWQTLDCREENLIILPPEVNQVRRRNVGKS